MWGTPKSHAKETIQLDIIFACHKLEQDPRKPMKPSPALEQVASITASNPNPNRK